VTLKLTNNTLAHVF